MTVIVKPHGGMCCGINHFCYFPKHTEWQANQFHKILKETPEAIEIVLTTTKKGWPEEIVKAGGKEVYRFNAPHTPNTLVVYFIPNIGARNKGKKND